MGACLSSPAAVALKPREECWHFYYGDVHAGTIAIRTGNPHEDPWEWTCGFYPESEPGEQQNGTAATFDEARAGARGGCRYHSAGLISKPASFSR